jgi:hypothetical protein
VCRNPQHRNLLSVVSATSAPPVSTSSSSEKRLSPRCEPLYATNTSHRKQEIFLYKCPLYWEILPTEENTQQNVALRCYHLKHFSHFDYWNQPVNMRFRCLGCHEAGQCCYLVLYIENLLRPLQLFYFHLWPIYWLSLV